MSTKEQTPKEKKTKKGKKNMWIILGIIAAILILTGTFIGINSKKNVTAMNNCIDTVVAELEKSYTLTPRDPGEFSKIKVMGIMNFDVEQYDIEDLGNLSIMKMNAGIMQMATAVITPTDKNLPLFSIDYIYILSNRKSYLEFYDVVEEKDARYQELMTSLTDVKENYNHLDNLEVSDAWYEHLLTVATYKSCTSKADGELQTMLTDNMKAYVEASVRFPQLEDAAKATKKSITIDYTNGLVEKGGISTDVFKKELGEETTKRFFDQVFFGTAAE